MDKERRCYAWQGWIRKQPTIKLDELHLEHQKQLLRFYTAIDPTSKSRSEKPAKFGTEFARVKPVKYLIYKEKTT